MQETKSFLSKQHQKGERGKNKASCHLKFSFDYRKRRMGQSYFIAPCAFFVFIPLKIPISPSAPNGTGMRNIPALPG